MNWLSKLGPAAYHLSQAVPPPPRPRRRGLGLTAKLSVALDAETCDRLHVEALRVGVHSAELARAYIRRGLQCS